MPRRHRRMGTGETRVNIEEIAGREMPVIFSTYTGLFAIKFDDAEITSTTYPGVVAAAKKHVKETLKPNVSVPFMKIETNNKELKLTFETYIATTIHSKNDNIVMRDSKGDVVQTSDYEFGEARKSWGSDSGSETPRYVRPLTQAEQKGLQDAWTAMKAAERAYARLHSTYKVSARKLVEAAQRKAAAHSLKERDEVADVEAQADADPRLAAPKKGSTRGR